MTDTASFPPADRAPRDWTMTWAQRLVDVVNRLVSKANCAASVTLTANAASTTMTDARLSPFSVLTFMPITASAATAHGTIYVTNLNNSTCTINHANTADTDKTFRVGIHG